MGPWLRFLRMTHSLVKQGCWRRAAPRPMGRRTVWLTWTPNLPLCLQAQYGLTEEVYQLEATTAALKQKLAQAQ